MTTAAEFIAGFEGYAGRAYWDVNAWRLGYGSDTEGPDQVHVTEGMTTTKERALQNLALRIPEFQTKAIYGKTGMGVDIWGKLTENQKIAITSLVYNYGRLPIVVTPSDQEKTAHAIGALRSANGGVNARRRIQEAGLYLTPDAGFAPRPVPPAAVPKPPATQVPIPAAPHPAAPAGLPPISATSAGRRAAEQAYIASMLDQLVAERAAIDEEITAFQGMADGLGKLNPAPTASLPAPPVVQGAAIPVANQEGNTMTILPIIKSLATNWVTSAMGTAAGSPALLDIINTFGTATSPNWKADIGPLVTMALGLAAKDGWITGGAVPATPEAKTRTGA